MQYTLRNIPEALDVALRERARREGKSLNQVAVEALAHGLGVAGETPRRRDLSGLTGRWRDDPEFERAVAEIRRVDEELWK